MRTYAPAFTHWKKGDNDTARNERTHGTLYLNEWNI